MKRIVCYILIFIASFVWLISGGLLILETMHIGNVEDMYSVLANAMIPVLNFHIKGAILMLIFFISFITPIGLNMYMKKHNEKD